MSKGPIRVWRGWYENHNPKNDGQWYPRDLPAYSKVVKFLPRTAKVINNNYVPNDSTNSEQDQAPAVRTKRFNPSRRPARFLVNPKSRQLIITESNTAAVRKESKELSAAPISQAESITKISHHQMLLALKIKFSMHPNQLKKKIGASFQTIDEWIANPKLISDSDAIKIQVIFKEIFP